MPTAVANGPSMRTDHSDKKTISKPFAHFWMSSHQYGQPKRKKRNILLETDVDAADAVTFENVTVTSKRGRATTKRVKVALYSQEIPPTSEVGPSSESLDTFTNNMEMVEPVPEVPFAEQRRRKAS
jgi:hypothetical protein